MANCFPSRLRPVSAHRFSLGCNSSYLTTAVKPLRGAVQGLWVISFFRTSLPGPSWEPKRLAKSSRADVKTRNCRTSLPGPAWKPKRLAKSSRTAVGIGNDWPSLPGPPWEPKTAGQVFPDRRGNRKRLAKSIWPCPAGEFHLKLNGDRRGQLSLRGSRQPVRRLHQRGLVRLLRQWKDFLLSTLLMDRLT